MSIKVVINGMGVIGRELLRTLWDQDGFAVVAVNDANISPSNLEYLLKYDSVYHEWSNYDIQCGEDYLMINGVHLELYAESNVENLPLRNINAELVLDCTGTIRRPDQLQAFINVGAKRAMTCYYVPNVMTIAQGINEDTLDNNVNCTSFVDMETQVLSRVLKCFNLDSINAVVAKAYRSFSNAQPSLDSAYSTSFAKGRAAAENITPLDDLFAQNVGAVIPELNGKVIGSAFRSPVMNGNIMNIVIDSSKTYDKNDIIVLLKQSDLLEVSTDPLCSSDALYLKGPCALCASIKVIKSGDHSLLDISVIYDNIRGFCKLLKSFVHEQYVKENGWL